MQNDDDAAQDNGSDDLNDSENEEGADGDYDDEYVARTGYRYGVGTDEKEAAGEDEEEGQRRAGKDKSNETQDESNSNKDDDDEKKNQEQRSEAWKLIHRALELLCDLLSSATVRAQLIPYLLSIHWTVRCRNAVGTSTFSIANPDMLLTQQLLERVDKWMHGFPIVVAAPTTSNRARSSSSSHYSVVERRSVYHRRAGIFQKMCHRYFAEQLPDIIYAGAGLLCVRPPPLVNGSSRRRRRPICDKLWVV